MAIDLVSRNSSVALVTIHLRDINDHRPTFPESHYNLSIFEHSPVGSVVTNSIHVSDGGQGWARLGVMEGRPGTVALSSLHVIWCLWVSANVHAHVSMYGGGVSSVNLCQEAGSLVSIRCGVGSESHRF